MKTIYECSQSKSVKWITAIFILAMVLGVLTEMYHVSKGMNVTGAIIVSTVLNVVFLM
jgi:hydrogenase/urease accessory protein HupE